MIPVYVVSLARATDRREAMRRHLETLGIQFELIDAVDGMELSESEIARRVAPGCAIHRGAIGCYLSHVIAYEIIAAHQVPVALVLEDDARLDRRVKSLLENNFQSLDFDYCFLDCDPHNDQGPVFFDVDSRVELANGVFAYELSGGPQALHSYFISLEGAKRRLAYAYPIVKPIDLYDHLSYAPRFRAVVAPKLAWVGEQSLTSFTSAKSMSTSALHLRFLRRYAWFFRARNWLLMKELRRRLRIPLLVSEGKLARGRRWRPLPEGRDILLGI